VLIERQVAVLGTAGIAAGIAGALLSTNLLTSYLYDQPRVDATTYIVAIAVIGAALLVASIVPAMRAARLNPLAALRQP
jgi:ABC-type antimicrobial peptide transport system permease subunit